MFAGLQYIDNNQLMPFINFRNVERSFGVEQMALFSEMSFLPDDNHQASPPSHLPAPLSQRLFGSKECYIVINQELQKVQSAHLSAPSSVK